MKILLLHNNSSDYLAASIFHGLQSLPGICCVDVPRFDIMYQQADLTAVRGNGFSLFGLLPVEEAVAKERQNWESNLASFDLILVSGLRENAALLTQLLKAGYASRMAILDGADSPAYFPFEAIAQNFGIHYQSFINGLHRLRYFKREWIPGAAYGSLSRPLFHTLVQHLFPYSQVFPISFGIPEEKIRHPDEVEKSKDWPTSIVDAELAACLRDTKVHPLGTTHYVFKTEQDYYADLAAARYGVTTRRAGWDCLRHYELAANAAVLCFRQLQRKPQTCAPHDLSVENCIMYQNAGSLLETVRFLSESRYRQLQMKGWEWIRQRSTTAIATRMLQQLGF